MYYQDNNTFNVNVTMFQYSEEQLKPLAENYFKRGETKVYATSDGNFFLEKDYAQGVRHRDKYNLDWFTFEGESTEGSALLGDKRIIGQVIEESDRMLDAEKKADERLAPGTDKTADAGTEKTTKKK